MNRIGVVLDKSGSMSIIRGDTIGGFNSWLEAIQKTDQDARVTLTLFDTNVTKLWKSRPLADCQPLLLGEYVTLGNTALNDALGDTLDAMERQTKKVDRNLVVIITDGQENSSQRWTMDLVRRRIERLTEKGWEFIFLGAGINAFTESEKYGVNLTYQYAQTSGSTNSMYNTLGSVTSSWNAGTTTTDNKSATIDTEGNVTDEPATP